MSVCLHRSSVYLGMRRSLRSLLLHDCRWLIQDKTTQLRDGRYSSAPVLSVSARLFPLSRPLLESGSYVPCISLRPAELAVSCFVTTSNSRPASPSLRQGLSMYRGYVPICKRPCLRLPCPKNTFLLGRPTVLGRAGCRCTLCRWQQGQGPTGGAVGRGLMYLGTHRTYLVYTTLSSAPRVCSELELQGTGSTYPGPWFRHTSSFGGLCSRALSYRVSRLPPSRLVWSLVSILRISSVKVYVPVPE